MRNMCRGAQGPERALDHLELDSKGSELLDMGTENRTEVLWKGS